MADECTPRKASAELLEKMLADLEGDPRLSLQSIIARYWETHQSHWQGHNGKRREDPARVDYMDVPDPYLDEVWHLWNLAARALEHSSHILTMRILDGEPSSPSAELRRLASMVTAKPTEPKAVDPMSMEALIERAKATVPVKLAEFADEVINSVGDGKLVELEHHLDSIVTHFVRVTAYLGARGWGESHAGAVKKSNRVVKAARKALGYNVTHDLKF